MKRPNNQPKTTPKKQFLACNNKSTLNAQNGALGDYVLFGDLPKEKTKTQLENSIIKYVPFLNEHNNLYNEIFGAMQTSPTNAAILAKKNRMIVGDGVFVEPRKSIVLRSDTQATDAQLIAIDEYLSSISVLKTTVIEELQKVTADFNAFGNAYVELTKSSSDIDGFYVKRYYQRHIPFAHGRIKKMEGTEIQPSAIGISQKWDTNQQIPDDLVELPLYPNWATIKDKDGAKVERCILHIKNYHPDFLYYGCPSYIAGILHCELEYRIAKYNQSEFNNGFMVSGFLQLFGAMTPEEAQEAVLAIEEKYTGTGNNSKLITQVIANKEDAAQFISMQQDKEGSWLELSQLSRENIVTAHEWTASMAGLMSAGSLGSNQQIRTEIEMLQSTVIKPIQNQILGQWLNETLLEAGKFEGKDFGNNQLGILNSMPISLAGDVPTSVVLTIDEQRELLGYEPLNIKNDGNDTN